MGLLLRRHYKEDKPVANKEQAKPVVVKEEKKPAPKKKK